MDSSGCVSDWSAGTDILGGDRSQGAGGMWLVQAWERLLQKLSSLCLEICFQSLPMEPVTALSFTG